MSATIMVGNMRDRLKELPDASIDACVTDPPYHLTSIVKRFGSSSAAPVKAGATGAYVRASRGFMGQTWDGGNVAFDPETWVEVYRVLKPGAHVVAFSGTRTYHRMACAIEDAGFDIRDMIAWLYGSGFPKSHNQPGGWGTALKPALEPICLARKPLSGTVAANVALHGTGAINIDGCRIGTDGARNNGRAAGTNGIYGHIGATKRTDYGKGRWPANVIHDGSDEVVEAFPESDGQQAASLSDGSAHGNTVYGKMRNAGPVIHPRGDTGSASRFFYSGKATQAERGEGNTHPTVKPFDVMRWLCRLITPVGGIVLDPFMGSGSTLIAADAEQFNAIGVELSAEYADIAERRIRDAAGLFAEVRRA